MSGQTSYPRKVSQRDSDCKRKKLAIEDSNKIVPDEFEIDLCAPFELPTEVIEGTQSSTEEQRDLFGVLIPDDKWGSNSKLKTKSNKKSLVCKPYKSKKNSNIVSSDSTNKRHRIFIPHPRMLDIMKEAQRELYSLMGLNKSSDDVSASSKSTESLNISGVQPLDESSSNLNVSLSEEKSSGVLNGVVAVVDTDNAQLNLETTELLIKLGAKVEKTVNLEVTHVVFDKGNYSTFEAARKSKLPLVTAAWVENCNLDNEMKNPRDYRCAAPYDHDTSIVDRIVSSMETPPRRKTLQNLDNVLKGLSKQMYHVLNAESCLLDEGDIGECHIPGSIKLLRKCLTPKRKNVKYEHSNLENDLTIIEKKLKLNSDARTRFRKLLFNPDDDLNKDTNLSDLFKLWKGLPSPSPRRKKSRRTSGPY